MSERPPILAVLVALAALGGLALWPLVEGIGLAPPPLAVVLIAGASVLSAAFVLTWTVDAAERDVPAVLALSVLALIGILPEFAIDATYAWSAATEPDDARYVIASMTGGNRLLLGAGWPLIVLVGALWLGRRTVTLPPDARLNLAVLSLASLWCLVPTFLGRLTIIDAAALAALYGVAIVGAARGPADDPSGEDVPMVGPARLLAQLPRWPRWIGLLAALGLAAFTILQSAEPFADNLVELGRSSGLEEFLLIQWVAPLASEAPEFLVAVILAMVGHPAKGLVVLIAAKLSQWTLLVGAMPLVTSIAAGELRSVPLDDRQTGELGLTIAQTALGVALLAGLRLGPWSAGAIFALFLVQLAVPGSEPRGIFAWIYVALAVGVFVVSGRSRRATLDLGRAVLAAIGLVAPLPESTGDQV